MSNAPTLTEGLQHRDLPAQPIQLREADDGAREVSGIGVPFNDPIEFWGIREQFAPGAVEVAENAMLFWSHREPIGKIIDHHSDEKGWHHRSVISKTARGDEAYTLTRDGVIDRFSIGFEPIEHIETKDDDGTLTITHTKVRVREVSLVPFPAYDGATLTEVRNARQQPKEEPMTASTTHLKEDVTEIREGLDDLKRSVELIRDAAPAAPEPVETRSAGELLKAAVVERDETAIRALTENQERAFDGATIADSVAQPGWVGDLTRLVDQGAGIRALFATGTLPGEGMNIEYAQLKSDTTKVEKQAEEGEDLAFGKVALETKSAPVETYGGYTSLSRQAIERSSVRILDHSLRALAIAAGKEQANRFRAHYAAAVSAQRTANNTVDVPAGTDDYADWLDAVVDAAEKYEDLALSLDGLIVDKTLFKAFNRFKGEDGRPMFVVHGTGANSVGELNVTALKGNIASVPVYLNAKQTTPGAAFFNSLAIRSYESPLVRLQDENTINLTNSFSVYRYGAAADEIPAAIIPVKMTESGE